MAQFSVPPADTLALVRARRPLIHHITNQVVMNDTANITLAIGALPVMAMALEEVEEMVGLASALVLNIGTLFPAQVEAMLRAGHRANQQGIPIVLDPVGAGATQYRTKTALQLARELQIAVIRGNAAEIGALVGIAGETRGVESIALAKDPAEVVIQAARELGTTVAITGATDYISNGQYLAQVANGHPRLATITGSGCMATALIGALLAVSPDGWHAATVALAIMGIAGENAAPLSHGPGTFRSHLLDAVAELDAAQFTACQRISLSDV
jgi:hydroxyethylthiazole kinase